MMHPTQKIIQVTWCVVFLFVCSVSVNAGLSKEDQAKRDKVRNAFNQGLLDPYDLSFSDYANLEMWDELNSIFEANTRNMIRYKLPGTYYSRPFIFKDELWVFENSSAGKGQIFIFKPDTLEFIRNIKHEPYAKYDGGIRKIYYNTILSGASDTDVDVSAIWNTENNEVQTIKLNDGHYISNIEIIEDHIYIGSCGGKINVWKFDDLKYEGSYSTSQEENTDWDTFNKKECISGILVWKDIVYGAGDKNIYLWSKKDKSMQQAVKKVLMNSSVYFYKNYLIEYQGTKLIIRNIEDNQTLGKIQTENPIEDLIVTSEKLFKGQVSDLLIVSLQFNKGVEFYDFDQLKSIRRLDVKAKSLTAHKNRLYATDDQYLYQYYIFHQQPEKFKKFLKTVQPEQITVSDGNYRSLLNLSLLHPDVIPTSVVAEKYLKLKQLEISHSFRYGKIGERFVSDKQSDKNVSGKGAEDGFKEDVFGYRAICSIQNASKQSYYLTLVSEWSGTFSGEASSDPKVPVKSSAKTYEEVIFIEPNGKKAQVEFIVGEKEPKEILIYPAEIQVVPEDYYKGLLSALSKENMDIGLVETYLQDQRVKKWHLELSEKKTLLEKDAKKGFWLFRIFRNWF